MKIIRILGSTSGLITPVDGQYLKSCDVDARDGRGMVVATERRENAMQFPDLVAAGEYWKRSSLVTPKRPDGKPNRPLTAYTIEVIDA